LEAACALGRRGYKVMLAEAGRELVGRVTREAQLPGMSEYARVRDYRVGQLAQMPNVEIFRQSRITAADVRAAGADHVVIATGARWRKLAFDGKTFVDVATGAAETAIFTPDDIMAGAAPTGPTLVYDEDGYYMGGVIAEKLRASGRDVTLVTPSDVVSEWAGKTSERSRVRSHLMRLGVAIETSRRLTRFDGAEASLACTYSGERSALAAASVVMVTSRQPDEALYHEILAQAGGDPAALPFTLKRIGDAEAPAIIAAAVYAGHRYARQLGAASDPDEPLKHDRIDVGLTREGAHLLAQQKKARK
jgi:dimethylamine/trimethylamine dehydrogenase